MLTERKRYNYNIAPGLSTRNSHSQKKLIVPSPITTPVSHIAVQENPPKTAKKVYASSHIGKNCRRSIKN